MKKIFYSFLAFPLSCLGIPLYIHLASFYFNNFQISLALVGLVIFICRIFDCIFDPLAGFISDRLIAKKIRRTSIILTASLPVLINFYFLFNPFYKDGSHLIYWLGGNLLLLYFSLSFISLNYEALVADFKEKQNEFIATREFMQIFGILVISVLPSIISQKYHLSYDQSLSYLWIVISPLFIAAILLLQKSFTGPESLVFVCPTFSLKLSKMKSLLLVYFVNSVAVSVPAVAIRFYVDQHLKVPNLNGQFLGLYFLSAAISVFIWTKIINKIGAKKSWQRSILLSVAIFIFATFITDKNYYLFYLVCFLSGFAAGCDLTAPQIILLNKINDEKNKTSYFAAFSFITKISLAISTFMVLNLIAQGNGLNYAAIPYVYCLLPCVLKILTVILSRKL